MNTHQKVTTENLPAGNSCGPFARCFFSNMVDYAGLFPPAGLPLEVAVKNFLKYRESSSSWILSRFVITAESFRSLQDDLLAHFSADNPFRISLLVGDSDSEIAEVFSLVERSEGRVLLDMIECRIQEHSNSLDVLRNKHEFLISSHFAEGLSSIFFELALHSDWEESMKKVVEEIAARNSESRLLSGFKLRCGGIQNHLIPSPESIAITLETVSAHAVPIKFTAGLHHPFRHAPRSEEGERTELVHGFFNVYFAALVAFLRNEPASALVPILSATVLSATEDNVELPVFDASSVSWFGHRLLFSEIEKARHELVLSFGSCSFEEPVMDAENLGWMKQ